MADRNALLSQIQKGKALKPTVTNDRSTVQHAGTTNASSGGGGGTPALGGLFTGGMPTLKHRGGVDTGRTINGSASNSISHVTAAAPPPLAIKPHSNVTASAPPTLPNRSQSSAATATPPLPNRPTTATPPSLPSRAPPALPARKAPPPAVPPRQPPPRPTSRKPPPPPPASTTHSKPATPPSMPVRSLPPAPHSAPLPVINVMKPAVVHPPAVEGRWTFPEGQTLPKPRTFTRTDSKVYPSGTSSAHPLDLHAIAARHPQRPPPPPPPSSHHHIHS
ncbi:hypothetical protein BDF22DRAFT_739152 [Syncephalis plumigaleata]|nr:hypothetical protein BDF22DRAFT_739152 [Syncephalis plumigaleata]